MNSDYSDRLLEECDFRTAGVPFDQGYVHTVEPLGKIDKRDLAWIGVIQRRYHKDSRLRKNQYSDLSDEQVADKYWSGEASDKPSWEWVTKEAKVIAVDNETSQVRPNSPFLNPLNRQSSTK